jgi:hypothetical protein
MDAVEAENIKLKARIADLEAALEQCNPNLAVVFRLPTALNKLLGLLLSLPNVTSEMVLDRLGIATDAKVAMHRLRKHMAPFGIVIESRRNLGYWIDQDAKAKIRAMLKPASIDWHLDEAEKALTAATEIASTSSVA